MREIKFRCVYQKEGSEEVRFVHATLDDISDPDMKFGPFNVVAEWIEDGFEWQETDRNTGLKDKNGKEIYEGDLWIARPLGMPYEIKWHETGWYLYRSKHKLYENADGLSSGEVIGNIYENGGAT